MSLPGLMCGKGFVGRVFVTDLGREESGTLWEQKSPNALKWNKNPGSTLVNHFLTFGSDVWTAWRVRSTYQKVSPRLAGPMGETRGSAEGRRNLQ